MPLKIDDLLRIPQSDMDKDKIKFNQARLQFVF